MAASSKRVSAQKLREGGISWESAVSEPSAQKIDFLQGKAGRVYREIEQRLIAGQYRFGDKMSVVDIAEELGVSRHPVMSAISLLQSDGYLVVVPQVGCRVIAPKEHEIADFFNVFGAMEGVMARLAATRRTPDEAIRLEALAKTVADVPLKHGQVDSNYAHLVGQYHEGILAMGRTPALAQKLRRFWGLSDFYLWNGEPNVEPKALRIANAQRKEIARAIERADGDAAEALMREHVREKPVRVGIVGRS